MDPHDGMVDFWLEAQTILHQVNKCRLFNRIHFR